MNRTLSTSLPLIALFAVLALPGSADAACNVAACNQNDTACADYGCFYDPDVLETVCDIVGFSPAGTPCGSSASSVCDAPDTCNGGGACIDRVKTAGSVCRAPSGTCDVAEVCNGTSKTCPTNQGDVNLCVGTCDACACTGTDCSCVAVPTACTSDCGTCTGGGNNFSCTPVAAGTECRASAGRCDPAETCTGASLNCPSDALYDASEVCRPASGQCDQAEACSGSSVNCPDDQLKPVGAACSDGSSCTTGETCNEGVCSGGTASVVFEPSPLVFPNTLQGETAVDQTLKVKNIGSDEQTITTVTSSTSEFPVTAVPGGVLAVGGSAEVTVDFVPNGVGERSGTIDVATAACVFSGSVTGTGELRQLTIAPPGWDFGAVELNATTPNGREFVITNTGTVRTQLNAIRAPQSGPFEVVLVSQGSLPAALEVGETFAFHVRAKPTAVGGVAQDVSVVFDTVSTSMQVKVNGVCTDCSNGADGGTGAVDAGGSGCSSMATAPLFPMAMLVLGLLAQRRRRN